MGVAPLAIYLAQSGFSVTGEDDALSDEMRALLGRERVAVGPMPAGGWPLVVYAHGTGGDARSFISDGTGRALAMQGLAVFGFDQIFNGDRAVGGAALAEEQFFNFANPKAARGNAIQARYSAM